MTAKPAVDRKPSDDEADRMARVALTWLAEPGNRIVWHLVQAHGAENTLARLLGGDIPEAALRTAVMTRSGWGDPRRIAEVAMGRARRLGARIVVPSDEEWPVGVESLATLELDVAGRINRDVRPPLCLWVRGNRPLSEAFERSVAIVGARAATQYGMHVTGDLGYAIAEQEWTVVSGGAFGIDAAARQDLEGRHRGSG